MPNKPKWWNPLPIITLDKKLIGDEIGKELTDKEWWIIQEMFIHYSWKTCEALKSALGSGDWNIFMTELENIVDKNPSHDDPIYHYDITKNDDWKN